MVAEPPQAAICPLCHRITPHGVRYAGVLVCAEHVTSPPPADSAIPGYCAGEGGHWATSTWLTPNDQRRWCRRHYREVIRRAVLGAPCRSPTTKTKR